MYICIKKNLSYNIYIFINIVTLLPIENGSSKINRLAVTKRGNSFFKSVTLLPFCYQLIFYGVFGEKSSLKSFSN